jgi:hypothetical protein
MRLLTFALGFLLISCAGGGDDGYPSRPGGSAGGGTGTGADAGPDGGGSDGGVARGRVCLIEDLRFPDRCATQGAGGISVQRGAVTATTGSDGRFDLPAATAIGSWRTSRAAGNGVLALVNSVVPYVVGAPVVIPAIALQDWTAFLAANNLVLGAGQGSLHVTSRRPNGLPKAGVSVSVLPASVLGVYYDSTGLLLWNSQTPGPQGAALLPGVVESAPDVEGIAADGTRRLQQVPVVENAITFIVLDFLK